ncbi:AraC family transcriptional regulator [Paenibacillus nasutitermitis]|nr:AraC family transcriptional regulator [Paenibacillus nasutitermitis]
MVQQSGLDNMKRTALRQTLEIQQLITMYYFEFDKNYVFNGEQHNFWEFLYVDKGEIEVLADGRKHLLKQGMIIFHKPNEFHEFYAAEGKAPNVIVITFDCSSASMDRFADKVIKLEDEERNLLAQMIKEGENAFIFPFRHPLERRGETVFGSEQLLRCYLEIFLIRLLRRSTLPDSEKSPLSTSAREKSKDDQTKRVLRYMEEKIGDPLNINGICSELLISKTQLKSLFKQNTGYSVMEYFTKLKIERAKRYIREDSFNVTEISQRLGFSSVHYFSKAFKNATGMSPSEYARSVKSRMTLESGG